VRLAGMLDDGATTTTATARTATPFRHPERASASGGCLSDHHGVCCASLRSARRVLPARVETLPFGQCGPLGSAATETASTRSGRSGQAKRAIFPAATASRERKTRGKDKQSGFPT
jgi:hypothetical protein